MRAMLLSLCFVGVAVAGDLTYRLEPGTALLFEGSGEAGGTRSMKMEATCNVWVVRGNEDGTVRLILRQRTSGFGPEQISWAWCDMAPDGSYAPNTTTVRGVPPGDVLPLLPPEEGSKRTLGADTYVYETTDSGTVRIRQESAENTIYGFVREAVLTVEDGLPKTIESTASGPRMQMKGTMRLKEKGERDAAFLQKLAEEVETYFDAVRRYDDTVDAEILRTAMTKATNASIQAALRKRLEDHEETASYRKERDERQAKYVGQPSAEWEAVDFDGNKHTLKGYRGKVVLLDFWYKNCGWCIRAMPQLKEVAEHFRGKDVVLLGMNIDRKDEDARLVMDTMKLNYPTLRALGIPEQYGVRGYPTLVLIDRAGIVRKFHVGFSPDLREELIADIEELKKAAE